MKRTLLLLFAICCGAASVYAQRVTQEVLSNRIRALQELIAPSTTSTDPGRTEGSLRYNPSTQRMHYVSKNGTVYEYHRLIRKTEFDSLAAVVSLKLNTVRIVNDSIMETLRDGVVVSRDTLRSRKIRNVSPGLVIVQVGTLLDSIGLKGDIANPGNDKYWGTNSTGTYGWYDLPTGGVGGGGITNLSVSRTDSSFTVNSSDGSEEPVPAATNLLAGAFTASNYIRLSNTITGLLVRNDSVFVDRGGILSFAYINKTSPVAVYDTTNTGAEFTQFTNPLFIGRRIISVDAHPNSLRVKYGGTATENDVVADTTLGRLTFGSPIQPNQTIRVLYSGRYTDSIANGGGGGTPGPTYIAGFGLEPFLFAQGIIAIDPNRLPSDSLQLRKYPERGDSVYLIRYYENGDSLEAFCFVDAGTSGGSSISIANNANNRVLTATGSAGSINGEANLSFDGNSLSVVGNTPLNGDIITLRNTNPLYHTGFRLFNDIGTNYYQFGIWNSGNANANDAYFINTLNGGHRFYVNSGEAFSLSNGRVPRFHLLAGSGNRMVVANSLGELTTEAIPGGGSLSFGTFGSTPNNAGASLASNVITLQPASQTNPGGLSTGTQGISGAKTFYNGNLSVSDFDFVQQRLLDDAFYRGFQVRNAAGQTALGMTYNAATNDVAIGDYTGLGTSYSYWVNGAIRMAFTPAGAVTFSNLAGSGNRMVVANASGQLSTQAIPAGGSGGGLEGTTRLSTNSNVSGQDINYMLFDSTILMNRGIFGSGPDPLAGMGAVSFYYPKKAAFRAGRATGNEFDAASIANYSVALGFNVRASGVQSFVTGAYGVASGLSSVSMGDGNTASGEASVSVGAGNASRAYGSFTAGGGNIANQTFQVVLGRNNDTTKTNALVMVGNGDNNTTRRNVAEIWTDSSLMMKYLRSPANFRFLFPTDNVDDTLATRKFVRDLVAAIPSGGSGVTTVGAFGSTPNANGASISGSTITLQPANATNPGGLSTGTQDISGAKTFRNGPLTVFDNNFIMRRATNDAVYRGFYIQNAAGTNAFNFVYNAGTNNLALGDFDALGTDMTIWTNGAPRMNFSSAGALTINGFTGTGTRVVTSDASGVTTAAITTLLGSASLNFPSTSATTVSDLTITVTGAVVGDPVMLGIPNGSVTATATYTAWVSAANTVTVRFSPKATEDPAAGTFTVRILR